MKRFISTCCTLAVLMGTAIALAQAPSASDFLPPADGGSTRVEQPNAVKVDQGNNVVTAATISDAANKVCEDDLSEGAYVLKTGSGPGYCAKGVATFKVYPNPNATIQSKRVSYVFAYTKAKVELASFLNNRQSSGHEAIKSFWELVEDEERTSVKKDLSIEENLQIVIDAILRGYVTYEVHEGENEGGKFVSVSIIVTPKTVGRTSFVKPDAITADSLAEGLEQVLRDVKNGLVTPVGGRVVFCQATGELAYVGFGCEINRKTSDPTINLELKIEALDTAKMRAASSLCGTINGDNIKATGQLDGKNASRNFIQDAYKATEDDPLAKPDAGGVARTVENATSSFRNDTDKARIMESVRNGIIPPGVQQKAWIDESGDWAVAVAVYIPSLSKQAADFYRTMQNTPIVKPYGPNNSSTTIIPKKEGAGKFGSGKVHNDDDL